MLTKYKNKLEFTKGMGRKKKKKKEKLTDKGKSKVLQHFGYVRNNSAAMDGFTKIVKVTKLTGL